MLKHACRKITLAVVCLLLASTGLVTAPQAAPLPEFEASFKLSRGSLRIGTSTVSLSLEKDGQYLYETRSWPSRWISWLLKDKLHELSRGYLEESGIRPLSYRYERTGGTREREAELHFDWDQHSVENRVDDSVWKMDVPDGTLDRLASQLGVMLALQDNKTEMAFNIADGGKLREYNFRVVARETLELPAGSFDTVKLVKVRRNAKRETYIWCAPELSYLPVRIWQREKDEDEYQSDLESFSESLRVKQ
ncbi:MAG: DUF3108 domain-containing protein [Gammaproteobacteria bacterium]|nr:DUF3108 domain-containing protein [Gammaproteobacteria bacterium]MDH3560505.1 DUF3108 domain-containing protein [Gammaproteobacteria bacterium]